LDTAPIVKTAVLEKTPKERRWEIVKMKKTIFLLVKRFRKEVRKMWIQKDKLTEEISCSDVLDWIVIEGVLWVEIPDEKGVGKCIVRC